MTPKGYTEDLLVEQPAISLMHDLGWETYNAFGEFDHGMSTLGRESRGDVVLKTKLREKLLELNPEVPPEAIHEAIAEISKDRSRMSMVAANREVYKLLKDGVRVHVLDDQGDGEKVEVVKLIDWLKPANNDYLLCSQFWVTGEMHTRRADLVGFVNGIPLVLMELKATHKRLETAFNGNIRDYKDTIPQLFWYNAFIILSNGSESKVGSVTAGWEHYSEWKKIGNEEEEGRVSLETMLHGLCNSDRLLDIVENFTVYQEVKGGTIKLTAKNHQYLGVNNAMIALQNIREREGRLGVFWHTQGSGKSISMMFFSQKVLRKIPGNWTFVVVTDRQELDGQIYKNFVSAGIITERRAQAESSLHLRQLLREDHRYVFTLIHKFRTERGEVHPVLSERKDIIVITDEAHRTQYDTLALNMRTALPNAAFIAFTGTPLIVGEEKTRQVFGDYISVYDFQQSVADKSTVPLYYENRIPELQLVNLHLNEDMERLLEEAELNEEQEKKLEREFAREYHLITREDRLEEIARDLVEHFTGRGFQGKAMMICIDKATAIRMYDKVKKYWSMKIESLQKELIENPERSDWLESVKNRMLKTDMAVVISQSQNEVDELRKKGLDIRPHRKRMVDEDLETKFKDPEDPFRLVFVCAMWMTGFDVPICSTLYLDKPMKNHTLMQTIARANRVYPGKVSGLIVDYVGVFRNLEKALAIYGPKGPGIGGGSPVESKTVLLAALKEALREISVLCLEHKVDLDAIPEFEGFDRIRMLDEAVEALVVPEVVKRQYLDFANKVCRLYKSVLPDPQAHSFSAKVNLIRVIAEKIRNLVPPENDITDLMEQVEELLDSSITGSFIREEDSEIINLSNIDFEKLKERFDSGRKRTINERLKGSVAQKVLSMVKMNRTRMNFLEKFQEMIDAYNAGTLTAEEFFRKLVDFARCLNDEEKRALSEELSEEELAIFDLLTKPEMNLSQTERERVKKTAKRLLASLKREKLVLDWRKDQQRRADVRVTIEKLLDRGLPERYTPELFRGKAEMIFQHIFDSYYGEGKSVYGTAS
jgi:type I restriction enzyme R subunit